MNSTETKTIFSAPDIECDGCATAIQNALGKVGGITQVTVDIDAKTVHVHHNPQTAPVGKLLEILDRAGFPAEIQPA